MQIIYKKLEELHPYKNNPRRNDKAVDAVVNSIREFGFKVPAVIDKSGEIIAGHTRYKAAKKLGMKEIACIIADDLTEEQIRAFRLADNKVGEMAEWDFDLLDEELEKMSYIDMEEFGFDFKEPSHFWGDEEGERTEEYNEFEEKFKQKLTTDDCYTPEEVYEVVKNWAVKEYGLEGKNIVRPFYPGGDYENENYGENDVVIDANQVSYSHTYFMSQAGNQVYEDASSLMLCDPGNVGADVMPQAGSPLLTAASFDGVDGMEQVSYIGAFAAGDNWMDGWTNFDPNNTDY